jgi:thiamine pyrophosphate-dependent acetolactate synthase large subunit-like protein
VHYPQQVCFILYAASPSQTALLAATRISSALLSAHSPLIITSFLGRNPQSVDALTVLSRLLSIPVYLACPIAVNIPFSHPYYAGVSYLAPRTHSPHLATADVILVIDCDLPWIPANDRPLDSARIFVVDSGNPLKDNIGFWHVSAELVCNADSELALGQLVGAIRHINEQGSLVGEAVLDSQALKLRGQALASQHQEMVRALDEVENVYPEVDVASPDPAASITVPNVLGVLRRAIQDLTPSKGLETLILNEGISESQKVWSHMRPEVPGHMFMSGGSSLGWVLGAAVGAHIGGEIAGAEHGKGYELVVAIVGDGSFLFGVPSSAYWMARKYDRVGFLCSVQSSMVSDISFQPFLTIILNNGGWKVGNAGILRQP